MQGPRVISWDIDDALNMGRFHENHGISPIYIPWRIRLVLVEKCKKMTGVSVDGIHGTPYIAAPWIRHAYGWSFWENFMENPKRTWMISSGYQWIRKLHIAVPNHSLVWHQTWGRKRPRLLLLDPLKNGSSFWCSDIFQYSILRADDSAWQHLILNMEGVRSIPNGLFHGSRRVLVLLMTLLIVWSSRTALWIREHSTAQTVHS